MTRGGLRPQTGCGNPGVADLRPIRLPEPPLVAETYGRAQDTPPAHRSQSYRRALVLTRRAKASRIRSYGLSPRATPAPESDRERLHGKRLLASWSRRRVAGRGQGAPSSPAFPLDGAPVLRFSSHKSGVTARLCSVASRDRDGNGFACRRIRTSTSPCAAPGCRSSPGAPTRTSRSASGFRGPR